MVRVDPSCRTWCPEDLHFVPGCLHFTKDLCCLGGLVDSSGIPCSNVDHGLWPKQSLHHIPDFLLAYIRNGNTATQRATGTCYGPDVDGFSNCGFCNSSIFNGMLLLVPCPTPNLEDLCAVFCLTPCLKPIW